MPANITDWGAAEALSVLFGLSSPPTNFYVALCTDEPGSDTDGTVLADLEPTGSTVYARQPLGVGAGNWADPSISQFTANLNTLSFGVPDVDWGLITHFALCTGLTAGQVWMYGEFNLPTYISTSYEVDVLPGALTVACASVQPQLVVGV